MGLFGGNAPPAEDGAAACNGCFTRGCEAGVAMYESEEDEEEEDDGEEDGGDEPEGQWT
mgnify:CR=1 FL=1